MKPKFKTPLIVLLACFSLSSFFSSEAPKGERTLSQSDHNKVESKSFSSMKANSNESSILLNDPAMSQKWGLKQIDIKRALRISQGSEDIVIAVIDTGIDVNHPDLRNNLWVNTNETGLDAFGRDKALNGVDDDKNGCIDDVYGCNFINQRGRMGDLSDNHGHGTHISGIISAEGGNGIGVTGVAPRSRVMTLKYYDPKVENANNLLNTIKAIEYAVWMKKNHKDKNGNPLIKKMIINYSGGGMEYSKEEFQAVKKAHEAGILFVAAAGNEKSNSDKRKYFPASYDLDNIISVTAVNPSTHVLSSSNYGIRTVDIAAPGENIYSPLPGGRYGFMTGTSQATAFVTGVAALIMAHHESFNAFQVKKYILKTGDNVPSLRNLTGTSKRLNSFRALVTLDQDLNAMGGMASNTVNMDPTQFTAFRSISALQDKKMADFGKKLMQALEEDKK